jgi:ornithine cyclodeaminase/alanine dehydrogenase-like protein (mu-crystallin family)
VPILVLSEADVTAALTPHRAIESQRVAYAAVVNGSGRLLAAARATDPATDVLTFALTGMVDGKTGMAGKLGLQRRRNDGSGLPSLQAFVLLLDPETAAPVACVNGTAITTLRTSAGLAVAADALAPSSARTLGVLGSGAQAASTVRMMAAVRPLSEVAVWSPTQVNRERLARSLREELGLDVRAAATARDAVTGSDIVAACTLSVKPVINGEWLQPGQTILTMGSYEPGRQEIDVAASAKGATFVDLLEKCRTQCGPLIEALAAGAITEADVSEIGSVLEGRHPGRRTADEILIFHSIGIGYQDAAAGWAAYQNALARGLGVTVEF